MKFFPAIVFIFIFQSYLLGEYIDDEYILPPEHRLNGSFVAELLGPKTDEILKSTVGIIRNGKLIAHGVIVDTRGLILSKASSSVGARSIQTYNNDSFDIRVRKRDEATDLALWQIISPSSKNWIPLSWKNEQNRTKVGNWALSVGPQIEELMLGVISAKCRPIGREGGVMGVILEETNSSTNGIEVVEVLPQAAGDRAGLKIRDKIFSVDGRSIRKTSQINQIIKDKKPGDLVTLIVHRKSQPVILRLTLGHRAVAFDLFNRNLLMSGPVSKRKDNFATIIQHDLPLKKEMMGGGLYDLEGNCLGINIARVDRVTTYSLPTSIVLPVLDRWIKSVP